MRFLKGYEGIEGHYYGLPATGFRFVKFH